MLFNIPNLESNMHGLKQDFIKVNIRFSIIKEVVEVN